MKFCCLNLGCKVNRVETDEADALFRALGCEPVSLPEADVVLVNTCTVTGEAEKKTRKAVHRVIAQQHPVFILLTGCAVALDAASYEQLDARIRVVPKSTLAEHIRTVVECFFPEPVAAVRQSACEPASGNQAAVGGQTALHGPAGALHGPAEPPPFSPNAGIGASVLRVGEGFNTRVGVKVQDGCAHACTYCIVHVARGKPWSKPVQQVLHEVGRLRAAGVREIVLTGINLGSYDDCGADLACLLRLLLAEIDRLPDARTEGRGDGRDAVLAETPMRIRLSSIEPMDVSDSLIDLIAQAGGRICRHLHLPLQSGSTKVLREMDRPYDAEDYLARIGRIRSAIPAVALTTDIIAGFPGETPDDFAQTILAARACGFSKMHVFPYSQRSGTPAAVRTDQVTPEEKARRAAELRSLGAELRAFDFASRSGTEELALVERRGSALTESYYQVDSAAGAEPNSFIMYRFPC